MIWDMFRTYLFYDVVKIPKNNISGKGFNLKMRKSFRIVSCVYVDVPDTKNVSFHDTHFSNLKHTHTT